MYSTHTHFESLFDTANNLHNMIMEFINAGFKAVAVTDHGEATSYEDLQEILGKIKKAEKEAAKNENREPNPAIMDFQIVFGVEAYVNDGYNEAAHTILIAKNYKGYQELCHCITDSNKDRLIKEKVETQTQNSDLKGRKTKAKKKVVTSKPIITLDMLRKYITPGDVYATSACIAGSFAKFFDNSASTKQAQLKALEDELQATIDEKNTAIQEIPTWGMDINELLTLKLTSYKGTVEKDAIKNSRDTAKSLNEKYNKKIEKITTQIEQLKEEIASNTDKFTEENAKALLDTYCEIFGKSNYLFEIQNHFIPQEKVIYNNLIRFALKNHPCFIAANDIHVGMTKQNPQYTGALQARSVSKFRRFNKYDEPTPDDTEYCIKTDDELKEALMLLDDGHLYEYNGKAIALENIINKAINNTKILTTCTMEKPKEKYYPQFNPNWSKEETEQYFLQQIEAGKKELFPNGFPSPEYESRLNHEIEVITKMGYIDYHLIVQEYNKYGKTKGKLVVGPGRGSAAGSLVCYLLRITDLDPIKYGLLFERFLNPERVSMPDIDMDFSNAIRYDVMNHCIERYGEDCVCHIVTKGYDKIKGAIGDVGRYLGAKEATEQGLFEALKNASTKEEKEKIELKIQELKSTYDAQARKLSKFLDEANKTNNDDDLFQFLDDYYDPEDEVTATDELQTDTSLDDIGISNVLSNITEDTNNQKDYEKIIDMARNVNGLFKNYGMHACGVLISKSNISDILPLRISDVGNMETSCTYPQAEAMGLLKMDFLGLITLDMLNDCVETTGDTIICDSAHTDKILNDPEVYKHIFSEGLTSSVFQFGSPGMKKMLKDFKPNCFEDIILLVACYRPGPMQFLRGQDDNGNKCINIINVKNGTEPLTYLHPSLEPVLSKTYGAIVYQEQVMQIFQDCAGYSLGQADLVRRAMGKKHLEDLIPEKQAFIYGDEERGIEGCIKKVGMSAEIADQLFEQMTAFASYAFNKSHAAAYAKLSVFTAYMLEHHPKEWLCSYLNYTKENTNKTKKLPVLKECAKLGVTLLPPSIDHGFVPFEVANDTSIRYGSGFIKGMSFDNIHYPDSLEELFEMLRNVSAIEEDTEEIEEESFNGNVQSIADVLAEDENEFEKKAKEENKKLSEKKIQKMFSLGLIKEIWKDDHRFNGKMNAQFISTFDYMFSFFTAYNQSLQKIKELQTKIATKRSLLDINASDYAKKLKDVEKTENDLQEEIERAEYIKSEIESMKKNTIIEQHEETLKDIITERTTEYESVGVFFTHPESMEILQGTGDVPKKQLNDEEQANLVEVAATIVSVSDEKTSKTGKQKYYEVKLMLKDGNVIIRRMTDIPDALNGYYKVYNEAGKYYSSSPKSKPIKEKSTQEQEIKPTSVFGIQQGTIVYFANCLDQDIAISNKLLSLGINPGHSYDLNNKDLKLRSCKTSAEWPLSRIMDYFVQNFPSEKIYFPLSDKVSAEIQANPDKYPNIYMVDIYTGKCYNDKLEEREEPN